MARSETMADEETGFVVSLLGSICQQWSITRNGGGSGAAKAAWQKCTRLASVLEQLGERRPA